MQILGVNEVGHESGNATITDGRDLPWLQETSAAPVWDPWAVNYRDVIIVNQDNEVVDVYNLTQHDLADSGNYADLLGLLTAAAP